MDLHGELYRAVRMKYLYFYLKEKKKATRDKMFVMTNIRDKEGP